MPPRFLVNCIESPHGTTSNSRNMKPRRHSGNDPRRSRHGSVLVAAAFMLATGCAADQRTDATPPRSIRTDVVLTVENEELRPFMIYLRSDAWTDSLGPVEGHAIRSFSVPSRAADSVTALRLEARERRSFSIARSQPVTLHTGHQIVWTLRRVSGSDLTFR
jgi:hypothetical protein